MRNYQSGMEVHSNTIVEQGWGYCEGLADLSGFVVTNLRNSWEHPGESDVSEQVAMWYSVGLVDECKFAFVAPDQPEHDIHQLIRLHPDAQTRYEAEAALATVLRFDVVMEPYRDAWKRLPLTARDLEALCQAVCEYEPDAVQAWHEWVWQPGVSATDHGEASLFAIAAGRLAQSMAAVRNLESRL